jgi:hypothetical protein
MGCVGALLAIATTDFVIAAPAVPARRGAAQTGAPGPRERSGS